MMNREDADLRREKVKRIAAAAMEKARQVLAESQRNVAPIPSVPETSPPSPIPTSAPVRTTHNKGEGARRRRDVKFDSLFEQLQVLSEVESENIQIREILQSVRDLCDRLLTK
jgi:hypothetical protein